MSSSVFVGDSLILDDPLLNSEQEVGLTYFTDRYSAAEPYRTHFSDGSAYIYSYTEAYDNNLDVMYWNGQDCMNWAQHVCATRGIDVSLVNMSFFGTLTGEILTNYTYYDFCSLSDVSSGSIFYQELRSLLERGGIEPINQGLSNVDIVPDTNFNLADDYQLTDLSSVLPHEDEEGFEDLVMFLEENFKTDIVSRDNGDDTARDSENNAPSIKTEYQDHDSLSNESPRYCDCQTYVPEPYDNSLHEVPSPSPSPVPSIPRSPSPPYSPSFVVGNNVLEKIKTTSRKRVRGPKNWEYLMRLLADKNYNPRVIRWEDETNCTFRIVKPSEVARTWGQRSSKPSLTYDNFARGLRYHYSTGALKAVSERQLVYKCGPKALKYLREMNTPGC